MTGPAAIKVEGARTLRKTLKAAGVGIEDLKEAHRQVAELVVRAQAFRAPHRTGRLAATVRGSGTQTRATVVAGNNRTTAAGVPYANPVHWGWPAHHIRANPWIYEAAIATEPGWSDIYLHAVDAIIRTIEGTPGP